MFAAISIYLVFAIEIVLTPLWRVGTATPDLLATAAVIWLASHKRTSDLLLVALLGLLIDASSGNRLGIHLAGMLTLGALLIAIPVGNSPRSTLGWCAWIASGVTGLQLITSLIAWCAGDFDGSLSNLVLRSAAIGIYSALLALPGALVWQRIKPRPRRVGRPEHRAWQSLATR
jgi:rod shape-determining protein MreD